MIAFCRSAMLAALVLCGLIPIAASAQPIATLASDLGNPFGLKLDPSGNIFFLQRNTQLDSQISTLSVADQYSTLHRLDNGLGTLGAIAVDSHGNIFLADPDHAAVKEFTAASGYASSTVIGEQFTQPAALVIDSADNLFVADWMGNAIVELRAAEGYATNHNIGGDFFRPFSLALDSKGNLFAAQAGSNRITEFLAAGGYATTQTLAYLFDRPGVIAIDRNDTIFVGLRDTFVQCSPADNYASATTIGVNIGAAAISLAIDAAGNLFIDGGIEIPAAGGYKTLVTLAQGGGLGGALDADDNLYTTGLTLVQKMSPTDGYATATPVIQAIDLPETLIADGAGNLLVANGQTIYEIPAASSVAVPRQLATGFGEIAGIALDRNGDIFITDANHSIVQELLAASNYEQIRTLGSGFKNPTGLAIDASGNLFVADGGNGVVKEILAASNYTTINIVSYRPGQEPLDVAVDAADNLFVTYLPRHSSIDELMAADGYRTVKSIGSGLVAAQGVSVDTGGNVFTADGLLGTVEEILAKPPILVASVLPGTRSVQFGTPATVFATMINTGPDALTDCQVKLSPDASFSLNSVPLTLDFQATDPTTNALTGTIDTPVTLAPNGGSASLLLAIQGPQPGSGGTYALQDMSLDFFCNSSTTNGVETAAVVPGVDTLDLVLSNDPVTDIIALAATATNDGTVALPKGGSGAFAVASVNLGQANTLAVSVDTGSATLPLTATLCQTNPATGQCTAPAAASATVNFATNATPTFSIFLQASEAIPFAPDSARVFVRFTDLGGVLHGSTSVAVSAD